MSDDNESVPGHRIEGFGEGYVLCSIVVYYVEKEFRLATELPLVSPKKNELLN